MQGDPAHTQLWYANAIPTRSSSQIFDLSKKRTKRQAPAKIDGQEISGGPIFAHNEPHYFDGNVPHCTLPFEDERYSIIAYLTQTADSEKFADEDRREYDDRGFTLKELLENSEV